MKNKTIVVAIVFLFIFLYSYNKKSVIVSVPITSNIIDTMTPANLSPLETESVIIEPTSFPEENTQLGLDKSYFHSLVDDGIDKSDTDILFKNYYTPSPKKFIAHGTLYGDEISSYVTLSFYGEVIRQQMWRGLVLTGSGLYGYYNGIPQDMFLDGNLLDNQGASVYSYLADKNRDENNQPIGIQYRQLNDKQKRIYDMTAYKDYQMEEAFIISPEEQSMMSEKEALSSGKYIGFVATKTANDIGRRFILYQNDKFMGVVLVVDCAKRADWTGLDKPTSEVFVYYNNPLIIRSSNGIQWGFDFTRKLYNLFGGDGGATAPVLAIDPDL